MINKKILIYIIFILFTSPSLLADSNSIYSFTNVHAENESSNSLMAKELIIKEIIDNKFKLLLSNLTVDFNKSIINFDEIESEDFLKNLIIENEIITDKKYIADLEIHYNKKKIINFYKKNNILFSDSVSPNFLILPTYNFDGSYILWEKDNWKKIWNNLDNRNNQLIFTLPNLDNINKILLSSMDIFELNTINIEKILNYYNLQNSILLSASKEYNLNDNDIYINLLITYYNKDGGNLENIFSSKININYFTNKNILQELTLLSYENIFNWWKNKTITRFNKINNMICRIYVNDIKKLNHIKNKISSISHVNNTSIRSLNYNNSFIEIFYFGTKEDIKNIFILSKLNINFKDDKCLISHESI